MAKKIYTRSDFENLCRIANSIDTNFIYWSNPKYWSPFLKFDSLDERQQAMNAQEYYYMLNNLLTQICCEGKHMVSKNNINFISIVKELLDLGANLECTSGDRNALTHSLRNGHIEISTLLLERGKKIGLIELEAAIYNSDPDVYIKNLELLARFNADFNLNNNGRTILHLMAMSGKKVLPICVVNSGADLNIVNNYFHQTALHVALNIPNIAFSKELLKYGALTSIKDISNMTPLDYVLSCSWLKENTELMGLLKTDAEERIKLFKGEIIIPHETKDVVMVENIPTKSMSSSSSKSMVKSDRNPTKIDSDERELIIEVMGGKRATKDLSEYVKSPFLHTPSSILFNYHASILLDMPVTEGASTLGQYTKYQAGNLDLLYRTKHLEVGPDTKLKIFNVSGNKMAPIDEDYFTRVLRSPTVQNIIMHSKSILGSKEAQRLLIKQTLKVAEENGIDTESVSINKDFFTVLGRKAILSFKVVYNWGKCKYIPEDIDSFTTDEILTKVTPRYIAKVLDLRDIVSCYFQGWDEAYSSKIGVEDLQYELQALGTDEVQKLLSD